MELPHHINLRLSCVWCACDGHTIKEPNASEMRKAMTALAANRTSVPQIWIGQKHIGGCDDLKVMVYVPLGDAVFPLVVLLLLLLPVVVVVVVIVVVCVFIFCRFCGRFCFSNSINHSRPFFAYALPRPSTKRVLGRQSSGI